MELIESLPEVLATNDRQHVLEELYVKAFPAIARFISERGGSLQDAKDIFQDALIIFYEKNLDENFRVHQSEKAYILGIAKHLWIRKYKDEIRKVAIDGFEETIAIPDDLRAKPSENRLIRMLERTGRKCLEMLRAFYYDKWSMREIATNFGYHTERSATVQKYKCLEKVRNEVKTKSMSYEDFTE